MQYATVVIGDMVKSRRLPNRRAAQRHLKALITSLNRHFTKVRLSRFVITLGDEFEGSLRDFSAVPDVIWRIETSFRDAPIRLGFGFGSLSTDVSRSPLEMDGEAFHNARAAIEKARKENLSGAAFLGFGIEEDEILNGFARILHHHWNRLTRRQQETLALPRAGYAQVQIAARFGVTESTVSQASRKAGSQAFSEAEQGFRAALTLRRRRGAKR